MYNSEIPAFGVNIYIVSENSSPVNKKGPRKSRSLSHTKTGVAEAAKKGGGAKRLILYL